MSFENIMQVLFNQQRLQILHIGKHHNEFSDDYLYAWEAGVYPAMSDGDGSLPQKPHESFADLFITPKHKTDYLMKRLDDAWRSGEKITFYGLEDELLVRMGTDWSRSDLLRICRYLYLCQIFDSDFWETLVKNGDCPAEAHSVTRVFERTKNIYFM